MAATRKRSASAEPARPMATGVQMQGFLVHADDLLETYEGDAAAIKHEACDLMGKVAGFLSENTGGGCDHGVKSAVQLVNTLFEVAAAVTRIVETDNDQDKANMDKLCKHAMKGLEMIQAAPAKSNE